MKEEVNTIECGRENDLVAFLYGELNDVETSAFRRHMKDCSACGDELHGLSNVRDSVIAWRNESLGNAIYGRESGAVKIAGRQRSAAAALREFFDLSPLWMKGALAFASVLFCLFAALAVAGWRDTPAPVIVTKVNGDAPYDQKLNALVEERVRQELQRRKSAPVQDSSLSSSVATNGSAHPSPVHRINRRSELASNGEQRERRPLSSEERAQLAADLRLVNEGNDTDVDLLDDGINK